MKFTKYIILILIIPIYSQFGKNIVQYKSFDWYYIQTKYFDIYYYDSDINAQYVAEESERAYHSISHAIGWDLKNRIPIIIYNAHNDFQQTNVIDMYMPEGVGGVTELYKNRVVIPYDGSQKQFRDVLHHELVHAFINDYIYKGNMMNMKNQSVVPIPLWMNEGLAEFLSINWNADSEMWIRDLVINGDQLPNMNQLNGWLAYRGGQSVWKFLVEKLDTNYLDGTSKSPTIIASIFRSLAQESDFNKALESSISLNLEELEEEWHQYLKEEYWPDINNRNSIQDIAHPLIDHKKLKNNYNIAPSISPNGEKVAFYSNKDEVMGIYIISSDCNKCHPKSINKILKGGISTKFEELHILKPGISWSSNSQNILFAAKSYGEDALFIIDIDNDKKTRYTFSEDNIKAIFQPSWNPVNPNLIAFIGCNDNQSDIYLYDLESNELENLTEDAFTDKEVIWSNDGKSLLFSSDRSSDDDIQYDLYSLSLESKQLDRLTNTDFNEHNPNPIYSDSLLTYICDKNGINNIYLMDFHNQSILPKPITNLFTGVKQLTAYDNQLIFTGLINQQFGIYKLDSSIFNKIVESENLLANWRMNFIDHDYTLNEIVHTEIDYRNYIFPPSRSDADWERGVVSPTDVDTTNMTDSSKSMKDSLGHYVSHKYVTRFTMDIGQMSYGFGLNAYDYNQPNGMAQFVFSDILGDHKIYLATETNIDFKRSDYSFGYRYLPKKIDWTFILFHNGMQSLFSYYDDLNDDGVMNDGSYPYYLLDQQFMLGLNASLPISKFQRFDFGFGANYWSRHKEFINTHNELINSEFLQDEYRSTLDIKYVWDNTRWAYTYPNNGSRFYLKYKLSPDASNPSGAFTFDGRLYKSFSNGVSILLRNFSGFSLPKSDENFYLGSSTSLWHGGDGYNPLEHYQHTNTNQLYFSEYASPVRGVPFLNRNGENVSLLNLELRAPLLLYYFPAIKWLGQINAIAFIDIGGTWNTAEWNITQAQNWEARTDIYDNNGNYQHSENEQGWIMSYGWGPRFILLGLPMQLHYSWQYNPFTKKQGKRHWELTIGFDM